MPRGMPGGGADKARVAPLCIKEVPEWLVNAAGLDGVPLGTDEEQLQHKDAAPRCYARTVPLLQWSLGCTAAVARKKLATRKIGHYTSRIRWLSTRGPVDSVEARDISGLLATVGCNRDTRQRVAFALATVAARVLANSACLVCVFVCAGRTLKRAGASGVAHAPPLTRVQVVWGGPCAWDGARPPGQAQAMMRGKSQA